MGIPSLFLTQHDCHAGTFRPKPSDQAKITCVSLVFFIQGSGFRQVNALKEKLPVSHALRGPDALKRGGFNRHAFQFRRLRFQTFIYRWERRIIRRSP
jgi:hypothetical protein